MRIIPAEHCAKMFGQTFREDTPPELVRRAEPMNADLLEQFFRRDGEAIGDLGRAIEDFQHVIAEGTMKFTGGSRPRGQFDPAETRVAFRADDIAFLHACIMPAVHKPSKTMCANLNES